MKHTVLPSLRKSHKHTADHAENSSIPAKHALYHEADVTQYILHWEVWQFLIPLLSI